MFEQLLVYLWENNQNYSDSLRTSDGASVLVDYCGQKERFELNTKDIVCCFYDAEINVGADMLICNVAIAKSINHWNEFKRKFSDKATNIKIVVVGQPIQNRVLQLGGQIFVSAFIPHDLSKLFFAIMASKRELCANFLSTYSGVEADWLYSRLFIDRMHHKNSHISNILKNYSENDWYETFIYLLFDTIKIGNPNREPLFNMCKKIGGNTILKNLNSLIEIEALLFGVSGLLKETSSNDPYVSTLKQIYREHKERYSLTEVSHTIWDSKKGSIHIVFAQLAATIHARINIEKDIISQSELSYFYKLLTYPVSEFWQRHENFDDVEDTLTKTKAFTRSKIDIFIINLIIPIKFSYHYHNGVPDYDSYIDMACKISAESNHFIKFWRDNGVKISNAMLSQSIIELQRQYCTSRKCGECIVFSTIEQKGEQIKI